MNDSSIDRLNHIQQRGSSSSSSSSSISSSKTLALILKYNNAGVYQLEQGNRCEAFELFKGSLELISMLTKQNEGKNNYNCVSDYITDLNKKKVIRDAFRLMVKTMCQQSNDKLCYDDQHPHIPNGCSWHYYAVTIQSNFEKSAGFVYSHGLLIQPHFVARFNGPECTICSMLSSIILYNIALLHHLIYLEKEDSSTNDEQYRDVAVTLYKKAVYMIREILKKIRIFPIIDIAMVIHNNMAVIYNDMGLYKNSKDDLEKLSTLIGILIDQKSTVIRRKGHYCGMIDITSRHNMIATIGNGFIMDFMTNVMYLKEPENAGAA